MPSAFASQEVDVHLGLGQYFRQSLSVLQVATTNLFGFPRKHLSINSRHSWECYTWKNILFIIGFDLAHNA